MTVFSYLSSIKPFNGVVSTACLLSVMTLGACDGTRPNDAVVASTETLNIAIEEALDNTLIPAVERFNERAQALKTDSTEFCSNPNASRLTTAQTAWQQLLEDWMRLANYNFGPLDDDIIFPLFTFIDSLRLRGTNYTGTVRTEISNDMAGSHALDDAYFAAKTFQKVGLLILEVALFETSASGSPINSHILAEFQNSPRKCALLVGLANQLVLHSATVKTAWLDNYQNRGVSFKDIFLDGELDDGTVSLAQLIISAQENLDYLQKRKVVSTTAQLSGHAWQGLSAAIASLEQLLNGSDTTTVSLFDVMLATGNSNAVALVKTNLNAAKQSITERNELALENALSLLDGNFKREIPQSLDIELGFNFSDGD